MSAVTRTGVCLAEGFGLGPGHKMILRFPEGMGGVKQMIIALGTFEQVEFYETGLIFKVGVTGFPNLFKFGFLPLDDAKTVHGNVMTHNQITLGMEGREANFFDFDFYEY